MSDRANTYVVLLTMITMMISAVFWVDELLVRQKDFDRQTSIFNYEIQRVSIEHRRDFISFKSSRYSLMIKNGINLDEYQLVDYEFTKTQLKLLYQRERELAQLRMKIK
jgi:hypothetical protein